MSLSGMDNGLSTRMTRALEGTYQTSIALSPSVEANRTDIIDLSTAQNQVINNEILEFFRTVIEGKVTDKQLALPGAFGGDLSLRTALSSFLNQYFSPAHPLAAEHIVVTAGAGDALESLIHAICDDGDSVIIPGPCWFGFEPILKARANVNIIVARSPSYKNHDNYLLPALQAAYDLEVDNSRIRAVVLCNPHVPLSRSYPQNVLVECLEFCQEHGLHFISNEVYALASLSGLAERSPRYTSVLSLTEPLRREGAVKVDASKVHVLWSPSKLLGTSGFRMGCLISQNNPDLRKAVSLLTYGHSNTIASSFFTALLTWQLFPTLLKLNSERLNASYRLLAAVLQKHNIEFVEPTHGIFLFARVGKRLRSVKAEDQFFKSMSAPPYGVQVSPGKLYSGVEGEHGWARISFAFPPDIMAEAVKRLDNFITKDSSY